jgi:hypothetical protein
MPTFTTTLWGSGNNVGIVVPEDVVLSLGRGKRVAVTVTLDGGYSWRSSIVSMGGQFLISFNSQIRADTGRGAGDEVEIQVEIDDAPRTVDPPAALAAALAADPGATERWAALSYSKQRAHAESVAGAKTDETRDKRVAKVLEALRA